MAFEQGQQKWDKFFAERNANYNNLYWQEKIDDVKGNIGSFDLENKTITGPQNKLLDASTMWNQYLKAAQSRGVKPDYTTWKQNYNLLVKQDNQQFLNTLDSAMASGMKIKDIQKAIVNDVSMKDRLMNVITQAEDLESKQRAAAYLKKPKKTIFEKMLDNPLTTAAGGYGAYKAAQKFMPNYTPWDGGKGGKGKFGFGGALGVAASGEVIQNALEAMGLDVQDADKLAALGQGGLAAGLGGAQGAKDLATYIFGGKKGRKKIKGRYTGTGKSGTKTVTVEEDILGPKQGGKGKVKSSVKTATKPTVLALKNGQKLLPGRTVPSNLLPLSVKNKNMPVVYKGTTALGKPLYQYDMGRGRTQVIDSGTSKLISGDVIDAEFREVTGTKPVKKKVKTKGKPFFKSRMAASRAMMLANMLAAGVDFINPDEE
tara:strand:+ start:2383 stop:3669 length:1287 start_codon:yes stop_codon:yes gene_type:complete